MRSQIEMRNMLMKTAGKAILLIKWQRNLTELCSCHRVVLKGKIENNEIGYLNEEISKQRVEGTIWFLLTTYSEV
jgi:hypothetical protein